jgi:pimeloyl-ACP methyl ester carboxylesterase
VSALVQPREGELKLNGLRIHYFEWKGKGERPLVLLHGLRDSAYYWQDFANRMLDEFHIFAYDQRGHGESEHAPGGYLVWAFAADLAAFVRELGLERFDLVGLSLGSRCAMAYARENWPRLAHLVLVDMGPQMARRGAVGLKEDMTSSAARPPSVFSRDDALGFLRQQWPSLDAPSLERYLQNAFVPNDDGAYVFRYDRRLADITTKAAIVEIDYLWDSLTRIRCPTLVLRGEESPILDEEIAARMVSSLPDGRLYVFRGAGHALPRLRPEEFARVVREFLLDGAVPDSA